MPFELVRFGWCFDRVEGGTPWTCSKSLFSPLYRRDVTSSPVQLIKLASEFITSYIYHASVHAENNAYLRLYLDFILRHIKVIGNNLIGCLTPERASCRQG